MQTSTLDIQDSFMQDFHSFIEKYQDKIIHILSQGCSPRLHPTTPTVQINVKSVSPS